MIAERATSPLVRGLPGCTQFCEQGAGCDPWSHEAHGYLLGYLVARSEAAPMVIRTGPLVIDLDATRVYVEGRRIWPSPLEWGVLAHLAGRAGRLCRPREILEDVWGPEYRYDLHTLRSTINRLRHRLRPADALVVTTWGIGWTLQVDGAVPFERLPDDRRRWAREWDACRDCGRDTVPHHGGGRCSRCHSRLYRAAGGTR